MITVTLIGATGRMGTMIRTVAREQMPDAVRIVHLCVYDGHRALAQVQQPEGLVLEVFSEQAAESDVVIDFSLPEALNDRLEIATRAGTPMVLGMTGLGAAHHDAVQKAARAIPVLRAPNTSIGVAVLRHLVRQAAQILPREYDIEVIEMHHRMKRDSPSGTALALGQAAAAGRGVDHDSAAVYNRHQHQAAREENTIGYASLRGGGVFGDHEVSLTNVHEQVTLGHRALDRRLFALGALRAGRWLVSQPSGLYGIEDMIAEMLS